MTPELRKEASELQLHKRGIRINVQLHVIEADEEIQIRDAEQLKHRLLALWAVSQAAINDNRQVMYLYLKTQNLLPVLSKNEANFLQQDVVTEEQVQSFQDRQHAFHFLAWCASLLDKIDLGNKPIDHDKILQHFPALDQPNQSDSNMAIHLAALKVRRKDVIMDWSDLLYRLHWAVRHAALNHKPSPGNIDAVMVREWHQAVNWMCRYDDENNWDQVSTETTA
ncbi:DUF4272 domain-containing protein [Undibacterium seohonense]|uniref:DUF4272 domain-containing protein n=1 Tax=Undibacterium seohonense TaxID=1344950 RepID=A0ABR6X9L4_9BURK|nr:DUF4272 domain-containing protein [Undibacterium seohonense]MBC3809009.1 DUF4272 domain-containing protein [Undibacterium seohonense]